MWTVKNVPLQCIFIVMYLPIVNPETYIIKVIWNTLNVFTAIKFVFELFYNIRKLHDIYV